MKQKIMEALKTKFAGVKDEILDRIATKGAKTVNTEEEVTTYVEGVTMQSLLDVHGDFRATEATKSAVANYEKKHNLKEGKPAMSTEEPKTEPTGTESEVMKLLGEMRNELAALKGEKVSNTRKSQLEALLKDAPEKVKARYTKNYDRLNFKDDDDFNAWLDEQKKDIKADIDEATASGGGVTPPKGGGGAAKTVDPLVQARINEAAKAAETSTSVAIKG